MIRLLAMIALVASLLMPHGTHPGAHAVVTTHAGHDHASHRDHASHPAGHETDDHALMLTCCDAMAGNCFLAIEAGLPAPAALEAHKSGFARIATALGAGQTIVREPPPPRS